MLNDELYGKLDTGWRTTCKIVLGQDIGELKDYEEWLLKNVPRPTIKNSIISGKNVLCYNKYPQVIDENEVEQLKNKIADNVEDATSVEDLITKVKPLAVYVGNRSSGSILNAELCDYYWDSRHIYYSTYIRDAKYVAYSYDSRNCENVYGVSEFSSGSFNISTYACYVTPVCFESLYAIESSNVMFSQNCENLNHALFCFNVQSLSYAVGNVEVGKKRYEQVRKMLLEHVVNELVETKNLRMSILDPVSLSPSGFKLPGQSGLSKGVV